MRAMLWLASAVVAGAVLIGAGRLWAENKEQKPAKAAKSEAPRTRIALVNLTFVIKNYEKYRTFQDNIKKALQPFQQRQTKLRAKVEKLKQRKDDPTKLPAKAKDTEEALKKIYLEIENNEAEAKKSFGKKSDEGMKILYLDVQEAVKRYAVAHGFDLVLHYNDATTEEDRNSASNISRKLTAGALVPAYAAPGMDISKELVTYLNERKGDD